MVGNEFVIVPVVLVIYIWMLIWTNVITKQDLAFLRGVFERVKSRK